MLIGRKEELKTLHQALIADESKFVDIYGRRRVGKTFLVKEAFNNDFVFYHTGLANETNRIQLAEFNRSLASYSKQKQSKLKIGMKLLTNWGNCWHNLLSPRK